jgi:hypothetical protein
MEAEQGIEWEALQRSAYDKMRGGHADDMPGILRQMQLVILPSFDPIESWEICREASSNITLIVYSIWQTRHDLAKFATPVERLRHPRRLEPTIEVEEFRVEEAFLNTIWNRLQTVSIVPFTNEHHRGCDGITYELNFGLHFLKATYSWWMKPPEVWRPLGQFFNETIRELRTCTGIAEPTYTGP